MINFIKDKNFQLRMDELCNCFTLQGLNENMFVIDLAEYVWLLSILKEEKGVKG